MNVRALTLAVLAVFVAPCALAQTTIVQTPLAMAPPQATDSEFEFSFDNDTNASHGWLSFDIHGTGSLDGDNYYVDVFSLQVNGTNVLSGTFNMSGGGDSKLLSNPMGATFSTTTYTPSTVPGGSCSGGSDYCGGITHVRLPVNLFAQGANVLTFGYSSPETFGGSDRRGFQGVDDETWHIGALSVTAVPEPETYAMLLAGLGMLATLKRRRLAAKPS